ncbi:HigA family addiction module antitoxin [Shimwellia blattae]|nr:HigA family addiction module antitoxin [Shimwellia blattae]
MKNPPHPGGLIAETLEESGMSIRELAKRLDVAPSTLARLVNEQSAISAEMAIRLAAVIGGAPHLWLGMQMDYDIARAEKVVDISHLAPIDQQDTTESPAHH